MTFKEKVIKEIGFGMGNDHEQDIAFAGMWVSRRIADGLMQATYCIMTEDEPPKPISAELRHEMAEALRQLAKNLEGG
jgi:hypothetical protein